MQNEAKKKYETQQLPGYLEHINGLLTENQGGNQFFIGCQVILFLTFFIIDFYLSQASTW